MNHLVIILHDNRVSFRTTEGRTGSNPLDLCRDHHALADYFTTIIPHDTFEIIDDRTAKPTPEPRTVGMSPALGHPYGSKPEPKTPDFVSLIAQCFLTALLLITLTYLITKHL